jgi:hypothetical protein
MLEKQRGI